MDRAEFEKLKNKYGMLNVRLSRPITKIIRHSYDFKCDDNGIYFEYPLIKNIFVPYKDIISVKPLTNSQFLFSLNSFYNYNSHRKESRKMMKKAFSYADRHGYDVAINHYYLLIHRKNKNF